HDALHVVARTRILEMITRPSDRTRVRGRLPAETCWGAGTLRAALAQHQHAARVVDAPRPQTGEDVLPEQQGRPRLADRGRHVGELEITDAQASDQEPTAPGHAAIGQTIRAAGKKAGRRRAAWIQQLEHVRRHLYVGCAAVDYEGSLEPVVDGHRYPVHPTVTRQRDLVARVRRGGDGSDEQDGTEPRLRCPARIVVPARHHVSSSSTPARPVSKSVRSYPG